jgi:polyferredoxin
LVVVAAGLAVLGSVFSFVWLAEFSSLFSSAYGVRLYCPRGGFFDAVIGFVSPQKEIPSFFRKTGTRIAMLAILFAVLGVQIVKVWPDPYKIGKAFVVMLTVTTAIAVLLAVIFHPRVWCCFCPIGTISNWVGRGKKPLKINSNCVSSKLAKRFDPFRISTIQLKATKMNMLAIVSMRLCEQPGPKRHCILK